MRLRRSEVPPLYALTPNSPVSHLSTVVRALVAGGARWLQIREKWSSDAALVSSVEHATQELPSDVLVVVNDRVDLALGCGAGAVHLGDRDLPPTIARKLAGDRPLLIGISSHSAEEAIELAEREEIDYVAIGPIFASSTKMVREPLGVGEIEKIRDRTDKPIIAIGGIDRTTIAEVLEAGADSAAIIGALYDGGTIEDNVRALLDAAGARG